MRSWLILIGAIVVLGAMAWITDTVTLQGERTVYTVECQSGTWQGQRCVGKLKPAERIRFRALKAHREVLFWTVGAVEASGKFTDCQIQDGRNWTCNPGADASRTITLQLVHGLPVADSGGRTRPFHAVAKWRWWLLYWGVPAGTEADV
jgi:hypothetical protein